MKSQLVIPLDIPYASPGWATFRMCVGRIIDAELGRRLMDSQKLALGFTWNTAGRYPLYKIVTLWGNVFKNLIRVMLPYDITLRRKGQRAGLQEIVLLESRIVRTELVSPHVVITLEVM